MTRSKLRPTPLAFLPRQVDEGATAGKVVWIVA